MVRILLSATVSAALCMLNVAPAAAQAYRSGFDAPRGATATVNLRMPLGGRTQARERLSYGLTLGYGQEIGSPSFDGRTMTRQVNVADIRFNSAGELRNARLVGVDVARLNAGERNMALTGDMWWLVVAAIAAGLGICGLADCFDSGDEDSPGNSTGTAN